MFTFLLAIVYSMLVGNYIIKNENFNIEIRGIVRNILIGWWIVYMLSGFSAWMVHLVTSLFSMIIYLYFYVLTSFKSSGD